MLSMIALGVAAYGLPPRGALPRPLPAVVSAPATTELGGVIHFPAKLEERGWADAEAALDRLRSTLGANAYVRWDMLWHETHWGPDGGQAFGAERIRRIVGMLGERKLRSLMTFIPHPWPGSAWERPDGDGQGSKRDWGSVPPEWNAKIAARTRESLAIYRAALRANGMSEAANAVQFGNEPASGHPGGNGTLPRGTWSDHVLWAELNREPAMYGDLQVVAPALSMLDQPTGALELRTARAGAESWAGPVTRWAMHFRHHRPALGGAAYARSYVEEMGRRARLVLGAFADVPASKAKAESRARLWVTEAYVAEGDLAGERAPAIAEINRLLLAGAVPEVQHLLWYRVHPLDGADRTFAFSAKSLVAATAPPVAEGA